MNKRLVMVVLGILFLATLVFAAAQEQRTSHMRSRTVLFQQTPLSSDRAADAVATNPLVEKQLLNALLTDEQRTALQKKPKDIAKVFTKLASRQHVSGENDV